MSRGNSRWSVPSHDVGPGRRGRPGGSVARRHPRGGVGAATWLWWRRWRSGSRPSGVFRADQFRQPGNFRAHYLHTGPEFLRQSGGRTDAFCDFGGTGGSPDAPRPSKGTIPPSSASSSSRRARAVLAGEPAEHPNYRIQGGGYAMPDLPLLRPADVDGYLKVSDDEAARTARRRRVRRGSLPASRPAPTSPWR